MTVDRAGAPRKVLYRLRIIAAHRPQELQRLPRVGTAVFAGGLLRLLGVGTAVLLVGAGDVCADRVFPKKGPMVRGTVTRTDTEVVVNRYRTANTRMTYGVVRFPNEDVKRVETESNPLVTVRRRLEDLAGNDAVGRSGLARYALANRLVMEASRILEEALTIDVGNAEALALYGARERFEAARRGNPAIDPALRKSLQEYLAIASGPARRERAARIEADHGFPAKAEVLERAWRSARESKGPRDDVPVAFRANRHPGASFTLYVPPDYAPFTPRPLLVALHDGGRGGKDGKSVIGSGRDALALYVQGAAAAGFLVACPTAVVIPWTEEANEAMVTDVIDEVGARFAVDVDRVFLVGHGLGADAVWAIGAERPHVFAGLAASSGTSPSGLRSPSMAGFALFLYHATDDPTAGVEATRGAADALLAASADVVYLELPDQGHAFPSEAMREMFDAFRGKRRNDARRPSAWPTSSFARKPSAEEIRVLGDPAAAWASPK